MVSAQARRDQVGYAAGFGASVRRACALLQVSRSALRYESRMPARDAELGSALERISDRHPRYGHRFAWALKALTVVDEWTRECLAIEVGNSLNAARVIAVLEALFEKHGAPAVLRSDNGPEFIARALKVWAMMNHSETATIAPGKPWQNGSVESFNGTFRGEKLDAEWFANLREAKIVIEQWRREYNEERPHSSLGYWTPSEIVAETRTGVSRSMGLGAIVALRASQELGFNRSEVEVHPNTPGSLS